MSNGRPEERDTITILQDDFDEQLEREHRSVGVELLRVGRRLASVDQRFQQFVQRIDDQKFCLLYELF